MNERRGIERVVGAFSLQAAVGDAPQVFVNQRDEPIERVSVSGPAASQNGGDVVRLSRRGASSSLVRPALAR
jgi:hypothetical protein